MTERRGRKFDCSVERTITSILEAVSCGTCTRFFFSRSAQTATCRLKEIFTNSATSFEPRTGGTPTEMTSSEGVSYTA